MGTLWDRYRPGRVPTAAELAASRQRRAAEFQARYASWSRRGRERADLVRGGKLVLEPQIGPPQILLPGGRARAYCLTCLPLWKSGEGWFRDVSLWQHEPWRCVLCAVPMVSEQFSECLCCGLPREVGIALARGLW